MTKKITVLMLLLLSLTAVGFGQTISQTNTQFPNPGFEKWTNHNCATAQGTSEVPDNWHTFDEVKYDAANILGSANIAKKTSHFKLTGTSAYNNSGASIQLALHEAAGIAWANGTMTSGRTRVGSLTVTSYKNYNYSDLSNASSFGNQHFYWPFVGCPDSMSFYYKTNWTSTSNKPLIKTYLHKNAWYDHANDALNNSGSNSNTNLNVDNYVAGCTKEFATSTSWKRFADKFEYGSFHSNNTDNNYSTLDRPQYILASFSTNKSAGGHETEDDRLSLDELWCIYDKGLKTLTINGQSQSTLLTNFNNAEFATHEPSRTYDSNGNPSFNNSGTRAQDYTTAITLTAPTIATITATPKSKLITNFVVTNPSIFYTTSYPQGTVEVTHNDNSTFTYKINFSNVKLAQPTASNVSRCGAGTVNLTAAVPSGLANPTVPSGFSNYTATCKWYTSASGGTAVSTGTNYSPSVSSTTTYYVSTYITYSYTTAGRTHTRTLESDRKAVTVTVSSAPTVSLSSNATQSVCSGQAINNITVTSSNGTLSVTGLPTGVNLSGSTISGSSNNVGAYPFTVTCASAGCPSATATGTITVKALPTVTISGNTEFCQGGNTTLTASGTGTSYAWNNGTNVAANTVSAAGNYTVTATLNGCTATASQQVTVNALPNVTLGASPAAICAGATSTLTASGATSYAWNNNLGSGNTKNVTPAATTTYNITGTDAHGCTNTASATVTVNALPTVSISGNTEFCQGDNTTLTANGASSYVWSNGSHNASSGNITTANTYTVTGTNSYGCTATASQQVTVNALPNVTLGASPAAICAGATSTLTASGATSYAWNNNLGSGNTKNVTPAATTIYNITGTDAHGCTNTASATVTVNALPNVIISGNTEFCQGGNTTLTASGASTYVWSNGLGSNATTSAITAGGTYTVTGTDANSCSNSAQTTVVMNPSYNQTENISISTTDLPYTWRGHTFDATTSTGLNTFTYNEQSINGCDSTVTLNLTVSDALFKLTVNYLYADGTVASPAHTENVAYNATYSVTSPTISGYAPDQAVVSGTMPDHDVTVNVTYTATNRDLTIHYQYADGSAAAEDHVESVQVGANYAVTSPSITGYTPNQATVSGTMGEQNVEVTVTYTIIAPVVSNIAAPSAICSGNVLSLSAPAVLYADNTGWQISEGSDFTNPTTYTNQDFNESYNGWYLRYVASNTTGTTYSNAVQITVNAIPEIPAVTPKNNANCSQMPADGSITFEAVSGLQYSIDGGTTYQDNNVFAGLTAGTYATRVKNADGCESTVGSVTITQPNTPFNAIISTTRGISCHGDSTGLIAISASYGTTPYTYQWSNGATTKDLDGIPAGTYTLTATDAMGCTVIISKTYEEPATSLNTTVANVSDVKCFDGNNGSITLNVTGGTPSYYYYLYNKGNLRVNNPITGLTAGTYIVNVKDGHSCSTFDTIIVSQPEAALTATITEDKSICAGEQSSITVTPAGGTSPYDIQWNNDITSADAQIMVSPDETTTYEATIVDANNCTTTVSHTLTVNELPTVPTLVSTDNTSCATPNGEITVSAPTGAGYEYSTDGENFQTDATFSNLSAGSYTVTVKNTANNCTNSATEEIITVGSSVTASASATTPCVGGTIELTGSSTTQGVTYGWTGPDNFTSSEQNPTIANATAAKAGQYTLTVTETATSCTKSATVNVTVNALPNVSISGLEAICAGDHTTLTAAGANSYVWNTQETDESITVNAAGTYTVTGIDANGCENTASHTITVNALPTVAVAGESAICTGATATLTASGATSYVWSNNAETASIDVTAAGTYIVEGTDDNGCKNTASHTLTVNALPTVAISGLSTICADATATLTASGATSYVWSNNAETASVDVTTAGTYTVEGTDGNGCKNTASHTLTVNALPTVAIAGESAICTGATATLTASGATSYVWSNNAETASVDVTAAGTYTVEGTDAKGCKNTASHTLTVNALPTVAIAGESAICTGATATLTASGAISYIWSNNAETASIDETAAGTYTVTGTDANGCENTASHTITVNALPTVAVAGESAICAGATATLTASGATSYVWSNNAETASVDVTAAGTYTVEGTDDNGCKNTASHTLTVNALPTVAISGLSTICADATATLTASGATSYIWNTQETGESITVDYERTFEVEGTDANGCKNTASHTLTVNVLPAVPALTAVDNTSCLQPNGQIVVESPVGGNYVYALNDGDFKTAQIFNGVDNGTYTVTVKNTTTGCTNSNEVSILTIGSNIAAQAGAAPTCEGSALILQGVPNMISGVTYSWTGPNNFSSTQQNPTISNATVANAGNYTFKVTETATGCSASAVAHAVVNVPQHTAMSATACETYTWTTGNGQTYTESNDYTYSHPDANGCEQVDTLHLTINKATYSTDTQVACDSYKWIDGNTYTQSTNTPTYTLTNAAGCDSVITLNLTINKSNTGVDTQVACESYKWIDGNTYTESTNTPTYTLTNAEGCDSVVTLNLTINNPVHESFDIAACDEYEWNGTTYTRSGDYTYSHQDNNGCTQVDTLHLTILKPAIALDAINDVAICAGGQVTLTANAQTADGTPTYVWSTSDESASVTVAPQATTTYKVVASVTVSAINANCTAKDSAEVTVTVNALPAVPTFSNTDNTSCLEPNGAITVTEPVGSNYAYALNDGEFQTSATFGGLDANTYVVTVKNTTTGCTNTAETSIVTVGSNLSVQGGSEPVCQGSSLQINAYPTIEEGVTYSWTGPNNFTSTERNVTIANATTANAGQYTLVVTETATGCTASMNVTAEVNVPQHTAMSATACETYTWTTGNGQTYTESNDYTYSHTDANGCEQVDTLHLTINKVTYYTDTQVACESYKWIDGNTYTQSTNTATYTLTNAAGCDSVVTLNLTINKATTGVDTQVACEKYKWIDGRTYTESNNTATYMLTNAAGCDSVVTLNLTINNPVHESFDIAACDEYEWNGTTYTRSGDYTYSHQDNNGCTQVDTLHLTILKPAIALDAISNESICAGGQVTLTANAQTADGTPTYVWSTSDESASVTVAPQTTTTYKVVASVTVSAINANCTAKDSAEVTVTVNALPAVPTFSNTDNTSCLEPNGAITVTEPVGSNYAYALNDGEFQTSATFGGLDANTYVVTVKNTTTGCTNTAETSIVTVGSNIAAQADAAPVCEGSALILQGTPNMTEGVTYSWTGPNNFSSTEQNPTISNATVANAGNYTFKVTETATGCSASAVAHAVVNVPQHTAMSATACETYTWTDGNGETYTRSGDYTYSHADANGCTQVDTLHLTINNPTHHSYTAVACDSFIWTADNFGDGATYQQSGKYYNRHDDANGCLQVDTLYLTINTTPNVQVNGDFSIVTGHTATLTASGADSYVWNTTETTAAITTPVLTETTTYTVVGTSNNCSTEPVEVTVVVNDCIPAEADTFAVACESFNWYEHANITESCENLTHTFVGAAVDGCDSIVTLHLTINNPVHRAFTETACDEYQWTYAQRLDANGSYQYTESGNYTVTHLDDNGCTQVDTLHLTVNRSTSGVDKQVACDSFTWIDGNTYTESNNTATFTLPNAVGCDSVVTLNLTILKSTTGVDEQVACETYTWIDGNTYTESNNTATFTLPNAAGCDSVVTLNLTINKATTGIDKQVACESFTWIDGNTYTESNNTATFTLTNAAGCDSVVTLNLTINKPVHRAFTETACDGYLWDYAQRLDPNDNMNNSSYYYTESNDYTFTHLDDNGCTQVDTLHLTVNKSTSYTDVQVACDSLKWIDGITYTESTTLPTHVIENAVGCDSVITLSLTILRSTTGDTTAVACETFDWYEHTNITESCENLTHTFENAVGCDSVVTLHLTINHANTGDTTAVACETFDWYEHTGITESCDNLTHTFENVHGCDSVVTLHLTVNHTSYSTDNQVACNSYTWMDGNTYTESNNTATYILTNAVGCDSVITLNLELIAPTHLSYTVEECDTYTWAAPEGDGRTYTASGTYYYEHPGIADCEQVDTLYLTIKHSTSATDVQVACDEFTWIDGNTYTENNNTATFTLTNAAGCDSIVTLDLTVNYHAEYDIYDTICAGTAYVEHGFNEHAAGTYTNTLVGAAANGCDSLVILHLHVDNNCGFTCGDYMFDYEYNSYSTKSFDNLCWMTENLRSTQYADGSVIPMAMVYNGDMNQDETSNLQRYGRLYDWNSAFNGQTTQPIQGVCPEGWRLPTQAEYDQLLSAYGMQSLRSSNYWMRDNGTNASEFDMRPGGFYNDATHRCENMSGAAYFYTADTTGPEHTVHLKAMCGCWELMYGIGSPNNGYSVRCVRDL